MSSSLCSGIRANVPSLYSSLRKSSSSPQTFQKLCRDYSCRQHELPFARSRIIGCSNTETASTVAPYQRRTCITVPIRRSSSSTAPEHSKTSKDDRAHRKKDALPVQVKHLMRHVPYPVAIITSTDTSESPEKGPARWRGATVSSFNTVALYPRPVVSFNIKRPSLTFDAIQECHQFTVHLFSHSPESIRIADKFTRGNAVSPFHDENGNLEEFVPSFTHETRDLPPLLLSKLAHEGRTSPFKLKCRLLKEKSVEIGDHMVLFGEVFGVWLGREALDSPDSCLMYVNGQYIPVSTARGAGMKRINLQSSPHVSGEEGGS